MKPILSKIGVFDATKDHPFQFAAWADIDLVVFIIFGKATGYNPSAPNQNDDGVYKFGTLAPTGSGLARHFTIPAGVLTNRHDPYYIVIRCRFRGENSFSEYSDRILFYCHSEPYILFNDLSSDHATTISYPSYSFDFSYNYKPSEGEVVNRYEFYLYDSNKELIDQSSCYYYRDSLKSFNVSGLDNHTTYFVRAKAESVGGYRLDTGFIEFETNYIEAVDEAVIEAVNNRWDATISIHSKYFLKRDTGANALRYKRRKKGKNRWVTIYQEDVDFDHLIMKMEWANIHLRKTDGFPSESFTSVTSGYITKDRILSYQFKSDDKQFCLLAYDANRHFLKATSNYSSTDAFFASDEAKT